MTDKQRKYNNIVNEFKKKCTIWNTNDVKVVFNTKLENVIISKINYIIVADNPGENEKLHNEYLYEDINQKKCAGYIANEFFRRVNIQNESVLVLNKTPIYTKKSKDLKKNKYKPFLKETMEYMAQLTFNINMLKPDAQVIIFGLGECFDNKKKIFNANKLFSPYFKKIQELYISDFPLILKHFSHWCFLQNFILNKKTKKVTYSANQRLKFDYLKNKVIAKNFLAALKSLPYSSWLKKWKEK